MLSGSGFAPIILNPISDIEEGFLNIAVSIITMCYCFLLKYRIVNALINDIIGISNFYFAFLIF